MQMETLAIRNSIGEFVDITIGRENQLTEVSSPALSYSGSTDRIFKSQTPSNTAYVSFVNDFRGIERFVFAYIQAMISPRETYENV